VQVTPGAVPRVLSFTAAPTAITSGQASTLSWNVENATSVEITGLGTVANSGTADVRPTQTTTYQLVARNNNGQTTAESSVTVSGVNPGNPPTIAACAASPASSTGAGTPVSISYTTTNASSVTFSPAVSGAGLNGPVTVSPTATTTYTITASGTNNRTATCNVTVNVPTTPPPSPIIVGPSFFSTINRQVVLDGSASTDPAGGALTYLWEPMGTGVAVLDQGQAQTRIQFGGLSGDYVIRLTVRNAAGQSASTSVTVRFQSVTVP
jgi:hypothetical protein